MRILIVAAAAAISAVIAELVLRHFDGPWNRESSISTGIAGAVAGVVSVAISRRLRKEG